MDREELEPRLVELIAGLRRPQVEEAVRLLLDYIDGKHKSVFGMGAEAFGRALVSGREVDPE